MKKALVLLFNIFIIQYNAQSCVSYISGAAGALDYLTVTIQALQVIVDDVAAGYDDETSALAAEEIVFLSCQMTNLVENAVIWDKANPGKTCPTVVPQDSNTITCSGINNYQKNTQLQLFQTLFPCATIHEIIEFQKKVNLIFKITDQSVLTQDQLQQIQSYGNQYFDCIRRRQSSSSSSTSSRRKSTSSRKSKSNSKSSSKNQISGTVKLEIQKLIMQKCQSCSSQCKPKVSVKTMEYKIPVLIPENIVKINGKNCKGSLGAQIDSVVKGFEFSQYNQNQALLTQQIRSSSRSSNNYF